MIGFPLGEVAPAGPLLAPLTVLAGVMIALGIVICAKALTSAFFGVAKGIVHQTIGRIPWVGGKVTAGIVYIERRVNNYLSEVIVALQHDAAHAWHRLARATEHLGYTIAHIARATGKLAWYVLDKYSVAGLYARVIRHMHLIRHLQQLYHWIRPRVHTVHRVITHPRSIPLRAAVHAGTTGLEGELDRLREWVVPRVKALEGAAAAAVPGAIPWAVPLSVPFGLTLRNLRRWIHKHALVAGTVAMTAAVAWALSRLGLGWVRCTNWRKAGRGICGMNPNLLDALLLGTIVIAGSISLREFVRECQDFEPEVEAGLRFFIRELHDIGG